ncbi:hypothetical protein JCM11641_004670 [Rhodosporidiobolus odoratus]
MEMLSTPNSPFHPLPPPIPPRPPVKGNVASPPREPTILDKTLNCLRALGISKHPWLARLVSSLRSYQVNFDTLCLELPILKEALTSVLPPFFLPSNFATSSSSESALYRMHTQVKNEISDLLSLSLPDIDTRASFFHPLLRNLFDLYFGSFFNLSQFKLDLQEFDELATPSVEAQAIYTWLEARLAEEGGGKEENLLFRLAACDVAMQYDGQDVLGEGSGQIIALTLLLEAVELMKEERKETLLPQVLRKPPSHLEILTPPTTAQNSPVSDRDLRFFPAQDSSAERRPSQPPSSLSNPPKLNSNYQIQSTRATYPPLEPVLYHQADPSPIPSAKQDLGQQEINARRNRRAAPSEGSTKSSLYSAEEQSYMAKTHESYPALVSRSPAQPLQPLAFSPSPAVPLTPAPPLSRPPHSSLPPPHHQRQTRTLQACLPTYKLDLDTLSYSLGTGGTD